MLLAILACWATFAGGPPALVNTDADGERVPLGPATAWAADAEATRVAFVTPARALPDPDANDVDDVYVKDLATGELVLASRGADGTAAGGTYPLAISGDGRRVAYTTDDAVVVVDLVTGAAIEVDDPDALPVQEPVALSHDGRVLLLEARFANASTQTGYLVDLETLTFTRLGGSPEGGHANLRPVAMSRDGDVVVVETDHPFDGSDDDGKVDLYAYDVAADEYRLVSATADGTSPDGGAWAWGPVVSGDGRYVVFYSWATNLGPGFPDDGSMNYYRAENPLWEPD